MKRKRAKKFDEKALLEKAHEERVQNAGALALNFLKNPARERVVFAWLSAHWKLSVEEALAKAQKRRQPKKRRA